MPGVSVGLKEPLSAPVKVMLSAVRLVKALSKVRVSSVVVVVFDTPLAVRPRKATSLTSAIVSAPVVNSPLPGSVTESPSVQAAGT